jgi:hypothetical protein
MLGVAETTTIWPRGWSSHPPFGRPRGGEPPPWLMGVAGNSPTFFF